jgi:hypothetical protein
MSKNTAVFGIYNSEPNAEDALNRLCLAGFRNTDVSILYSKNVGNKDLAHQKNTKAPEGAVIGAIIGAIICGVLGWLAGDGTLAVPGDASFIAAGPIMAMLSGIGVGGVIGGIIGALIGASLPEYEARRYEGRVRKGGVLISVHCDDSNFEKKAKQLLRDTGALDISAEAEAKADFASSDRANPRSATPGV